MTMRGRKALSLAKALQADAPKSFLPPAEGTKPKNELILPHSIVKNTRGYIEKVVFQINGCYEYGWFDGCAVMMRRLIETLIIECFEKYQIASKIKHPTTGDFLHLADLIDKTLHEQSWNISRSAKTALPKMKTIGDQSAHSRRFIAHRQDIDSLSQEFRVICQELIYLAQLK